MPNLTRRRHLDIASHYVVQIGYQILERDGKFIVVEFGRQGAFGNSTCYNTVFFSADFYFLIILNTHRVCSSSQGATMNFSSISIYQSSPMGVYASFATSVDRISNCFRPYGSSCLSSKVSRKQTQTLWMKKEKSMDLSIQHL
jgi:hypothetical protein